MLNVLVRKIRRLIYKVGFRPKQGSIWFSPSLALHYSLLEIFKPQKKHTL